MAWGGELYVGAGDIWRTTIDTELKDVVVPVAFSDQPESNIPMPAALLGTTDAWAGQD